MESHIEKIVCPVCEAEQDAEVRHTEPWWLYVHNCTNCDYTIMESEWKWAVPKREKLAESTIQKMSLPLIVVCLMYVVYAAITPIIMVRFMVDVDSEIPTPTRISIFGIWLLLTVMAGMTVHQLIKHETKHND